jgi:hypothetical protein
MSTEDVNFPVKYSSLVLLLMVWFCLFSLPSSSLAVCPQSSGGASLLWWRRVDREEKKTATSSWFLIFI